MFQEVENSSNKKLRCDHCGNRVNVHEHFWYDGIHSVCESCFPGEFENNVVEHPSHYTFGAIEVIDAIEAWDLGFHRGNAVKYIARAGRKDKSKEIEDLKKARWYLDREIERLEK